MASKFLWLPTLSVWLIITTTTVIVPRTNAETICDVIYSGQHRIQGVIMAEDQGLVFVNNLVYPFDPKEDFNGKQHRLHLSQSGIPVERYLDGVYLKGKDIFNVYMINNLLQFVMVADSDGGNKGFTYRFDHRTSYEADSSIVPASFPFVYFSNNQRMFMYQIPATSFGFDMRGLTQRNSMAFFEFNFLDNDMFYVRIEGLGGLSEEKRLEKITERKFQMKAAFVGGGNAYLITRDHVYITGASDLYNASHPTFHKKLLREVITCAPSAHVEALNWSKVITIILSGILLVIIFVLAFAIMSPNNPVPAAMAQGIVRAKSGRPGGGGGGSRTGSSTSNTSTVATGRASGKSSVVAGVGKSSKVPSTRSMSTSNNVETTTN